MTTDLWMLVWSALLCVSLPVVYLMGRSSVPGGLAWGFGNRDTPLAVPAWTGRAERAHANLVENLAPFAILVLVAHVAGKANATTALGAELFFWGRVAHAAIYSAGIVYLRTAAFFVGTAGELMILLQLFR
ncbi:MAG TPA: MAPEG family protein [Candidatus Eisenbacteria bacterium]|nr:MAPEG family protein [Candidatus Eisenbacteria bacterium]